MNVSDVMWIAPYIRILTYVCLVLFVFLVFLVVLIVYGIRHDDESEPDGNMSYPTCYGDYPKFSSQQLAERECWSCVYKQQCYERSGK